MRKAFTLTELMIGTAIFTIVGASLSSAIVGANKLVAQAFNEAEISVRMREIREKILFRAAPSHNNVLWSGILSGAPRVVVQSTGREVEYPVVENHDTIKMVTHGVDVSKIVGKISSLGKTSQTKVDQTIELKKKTATVNGKTVGYFANYGDSTDQSNGYRWLNLGGGIGYLDDNDFIDDFVLSTKNILFITLRADLKGFVRRERIAVPVFGKEQRYEVGKIFGDK